MSYGNDVAAMYEADNLYWLGLAHQRCLEIAGYRIRAQLVDLPAELPKLHVDDVVGALPALHLPPMPERCPFCDADDPSSEHVFPEWLSRELNSICGLRDVGGEHGPRPLRKVGLVAPVCRKCNNRWLSVLENDVKPILAPLIRGEDTQLEPGEQILLATWAAKTALMMDLTSKTPVIPAGFYHQMRLRREPPAGHTILLGAYSGSTRAVCARHESLLGAGARDGTPPHAFVTTFNVYRAVFQVIGHFVRDATLRDDRSFRDALAIIWPPRDSAVSWPPTRLAFNDDWLDTLSTSVT